MKVHISIHKEPAEYETIMDFLRSHESGAIALFEGVVRGDTLSNGDVVRSIFYESHVAMAHSEIQILLDEMCTLYAIHAFYFHHLIGDVLIGKTSIWLGISARHRKEAFVAQTWFLNQFKKRIPIWKKEMGQQSQKWVVPNE